MRYIQVEEWYKFQHYKKRNPPWIKLYSKLLENDDFDEVPDDSKLLFFCLLLFASRKGNKIKLNHAFLQKRLPISSVITKETLQPLIDAHFISVYQDDSKSIAENYQDATPETETETNQSRAETEGKPGKSPPDLSLRNQTQDYSDEDCVVLLLGYGVHKDVAESLVYDDHHTTLSIKNAAKNCETLNAHLSKEGLKIVNRAGYIVKTLNTAKDEGKEVGLSNRAEIIENLRSKPEGE